MEPVRRAARRITMLPFIGSEALAAGVVNRYQLATQYDAVYRNVYVPRGKVLTAADKAVAAWLWSERRATAAGLSAAALHGTKWLDAKLAAELNQRHRHKTNGIFLHSDKLADDEVCIANGIPATTPARTAYDLGRRRGLTTAVIRLDALMQATNLKPTDVEALAERHRGTRGTVQLREAISLSDCGAESPQETRTRLILTDAGLRPKHTQIEVFDNFGEFVHRIDMGWVEWMVGARNFGDFSSGKERSRHRLGLRAAQSAVARVHVGRQPLMVCHDRQQLAQRVSLLGVKPRGHQLFVLTA
jgi:hypothetical protein